MLIDSKVIGSDRFLGWTKFFVLSLDKYHVQKVRVYLAAREESTTWKPLELLLHQCVLSGCHHRQHCYLALCFHQQCYGLLYQHSTGQSSGPKMQDIWALGHSTRWLSVPSPTEFQKRKLSVSFSDNTWRTVLQAPGNISREGTTVSGSVLQLYLLFSRLPRELQDMIAVYALQNPFFSLLMAIHQGRMLIDKVRMLENLGSQGIGPVALNTSEAIYVGKVKFDGFEYVSYLSNQPLQRDDHRVYTGTEIYQLRISTDDLGIRNIEFLGNGKDTSTDKRVDGPKERLWYKIIRPHDLMAICQVKVLADVSNIILYGLDYTDMP